jgi:predicted PurR-regulated permease PerM
VSGRRPRNDSSSDRDLGTSRPGFTRRVLIVAGVTVLAAAFVQASDVFFLFFLAVLLAILLRGAGDALARRTGIGPGRALTLVAAALAALAAGVALAAGSMAAGQVERLASDLPQSVEQVRNYLRERAWGRELLRHAPSADGLVSGGDAAARVAAFFSTTLGAVGNLVVLAVLTLYLAASPRTYLTGLLTLVPPRHRPRAGEVLAAVGFHLRWWLVGRLAAMSAVGVVTGVGLWAVGIPQFLVLALIAALLTAVPFVGPIAAAVPGLLLALTQGPGVALWALGVYVLAQAAENYLVTPLVQQNTVSLPPALTVMAVVLGGALFGMLALVVATPLAVTILVAVKMLYVEDVLGERLDVPGASPPVTA